MSKAEAFKIMGRDYEVGLKRRTDILFTNTDYKDPKEGGDDSLFRYKSPITASEAIYIVIGSDGRVKGVSHGDGA